MIAHGYSYIGFHSLAVMYLTWGIGSIFSSKIIKMMGIKKAIVICSLLTSLWIFGAILPIHKAENPSKDSFYLNEKFIYVVITILSLANGFFTSPFWVAILKQIYSFSSEDNIGFYLSYFWFYEIFSILVGNFLGFVIFYKGFISGFFIIMGIIALLSSIYFIFLVRSLVIQEGEE